MAVSAAPKWQEDGPAVSTRAKNVADLGTARNGLTALLAHDLKTPLAAISMNLDFVLAGPDVDVLPVPLRAALDDCRTANVRAIRILTDMADAVRLQSGERRATIAEVDICALLDAVVERAADDAAARHVRLVCSSNPLLARCDADLFGRALERLLERALRHARAGGTIEIARVDRTIVVRVKASSRDDGGALAPESAMGGLAMHFADVAVRAQGGSLWTESDADGSLSFCVRLP